VRHYHRKKKVADGRKDASDTIGGVIYPTQDVECDLLECCNYFQLGVEYGECVAEFDGVGALSGLDKCAEYQSEYTVCTINGHIAGLATNIARCCKMVYGQFNCNIASQGSYVSEQIDYCCNTQLMYGWTYYSKVNKC